MTGFTSKRLMSKAKIVLEYDRTEVINDAIQWAGAVAIIAMHALNAVGPSAYPYNLIAAFIGTVAFLLWTIRVGNKPQLLVNVVAMTLCVVGLFNALG
jgi:hypothetical protein